MIKIIRFLGRDIANQNKQLLSKKALYAALHEMHFKGRTCKNFTLKLEEFGNLPWLYKFVLRIVFSVRKMQYHGEPQYYRIFRRFC